MKKCKIGWLLNAVFIIAIVVMLYDYLGLRIVRTDWENHHLMGNIAISCIAALLIYSITTSIPEYMQRLQFKVDCGKRLNDVVVIIKDMLAKLNNNQAVPLTDNDKINDVIHQQEFNESIEIFVSPNGYRQIDELNHYLWQQFKLLFEEIDYLFTAYHEIYNKEQIEAHKAFSAIKHKHIALYQNYIDKKDDPQVDIDSMQYAFKDQWVGLTIESISLLKKLEQSFGIEQEVIK